MTAITRRCGGRHKEVVKELTCGDLGTNLGSEAEDDRAATQLGLDVSEQGRAHRPNQYSISTKLKVKSPTRKLFCNQELNS
jgi:hypothetical protein